MGMESRAISQRSIARQDNTPNDTDLLWLDTTKSPAALKQYDGNTSSWEPVASSVVSRQDTAPDAPKNGDLWQDTSVSPAQLYTYDGSKWVPQNQTQASGEISTTRPTPDLGKLWFEPYRDGANTYIGSNDYWEFLKFVPGDPTTVIEGYEDGDAAEWNANTSAVQTTNAGNNPYDGSYMGEQVVSGGSNQTSTRPVTQDTPFSLSVALLIEVSNSGGRTSLRFNDGSGNVVTSALIEKNNKVVINTTDGNASSGFATSVDTTQGTWFFVSFLEIDFSTETIGKIAINGTTEETDVSFAQSASNVSELEVFSASGGDMYGYNDAIRKTPR